MLGLCGSCGCRGRCWDIVGTVAVGTTSIARPSSKLVTMLLIETVQGFQGVEDFMSGHSSTSQALKQVYLLYSKSGFICVVRHGFQQTKNKVKCESKQFSATAHYGTCTAPQVWHLTEDNMPDSGLIYMSVSHVRERRSRPSGWNPSPIELKGKTAIKVRLIMFAL